MEIMKISKEAWIGFFIGFLSPFVLLPLVLMLMSLAFSYEFTYFWNKVFTDAQFSSKCLSLGSIPNLLWFYIFLNRENYSTARGIILATLIFVPYSIYVNIF